MTYEKIRCEQTNCKYGTSHCCFGEYDTHQFDGKKVVERHKCKRNSKEFVYVTLLPHPKKSK